MYLLFSVYISIAKLKVLQDFGLLGIFGIELLLQLLPKPKCCGESIVAFLVRLLWFRLLGLRLLYEQCFDVSDQVGVGLLELAHCSNSLKQLTLQFCNCHRCTIIISHGPICTKLFTKK